MKGVKKKVEKGGNLSRRVADLRVVCAAWRRFRERKSYGFGGG